MEMRFYEIIGVRQWKKFVLWLMAKSIRDPDERKGGNYYLKRLDLESVKDFKRALLFNGIIHIIGALWGLPGIIVILKNNSAYPFFLSFSLILAFLVNLYCVMLQRYNWLRIKKVLEKVTHK